MMGEMGEMKPGWTPGLGDVVMENLTDAKVFEANGSKTDYASGRLQGLSRGIAQAKTDCGFTSCRILPWSSVVTGETADRAERPGDNVCKDPYSPLPNP